MIEHRRLNADKHSLLQVRGALSGGEGDAYVSGSESSHWQSQSDCVMSK